jgi:TolA-binding protein
MLLYLLPLSAHAASPDAAEVQAFRDTLERFTERSDEFSTEVSAILEAAYAEERQKIVSSYGNAMTRLEADEGTLRRVAIQKIERFLEKHPTGELTADMKFRLADLYFEESEVEFSSRMDEYNRMEAQKEANPAMVLGEPPLKDYRRSVALYKDILAHYPGYENLVDTYYMLGWCYSAQNAEQLDETAARDVYATIVERFSGSPFANDANMRLGEYYFDLPGSRANPVENIPVAIRYYEAVLADGPSGRNYDEAIYKLGWSHYKLDDYDKALTYLVRLLDYSDEQFLASGKVSNMRPEAVEYLAISYSDMADRQGKRPVDVAEAHLRRVGERKWEHDVIERLAAILLVQAKFDSSIETYRFLQTRWPLDPMNPVYQQQIARIYTTQPIPDPAAAARALADLSEWYTEGTEWYKVNQTNPEAVASARSFIETSLAAVATEYLLKAQESGRVEDYRTAAAKYQQFLDKFPFASGFDEYEWYLALALLNSNQFKEAESEYLQILKNERSAFRDGARYQLMTARQQLVLSAYGKLEDVPQGAIVERVDTTPFGKSITRYLLTDEHKAFLASCDDLADRELTDPKFAPLLEENRAALTYLAAQILYNFGHYDEARARFERVIARFPTRDEAAYAAGLYIASYQNEGDLAKARTYAGKYAAMSLGSQALASVKGLEFKNAQEQAAFALAFQLIEKGDRAGAAQAYLDFIKEFPNSKYVNDALYNAANNLELTGRATEAIQLFEQYVKRNPQDDRSKFLYFRIASTYSSVLDLNQAVYYYEQLVKLFPTFQDSSSALFNAAFLRVGLGDHAGAAQRYEQYGRDYANQPDAEQVTWNAGEQWELVGERQAEEFYGRYLKTFAGRDPNHTLDAQYWLAKAYERRGDKRRQAQAWSDIQRTFDAYAGGGQLSQQSRSKAAEGALATLQGEYEAFLVYKYVNNEKKDVELALKVKPEELKSFADRALALIQRYQDFDTASASLYLQGLAYLAYADMVYELPAPKGFSDEELDLFRQGLDPFRLQAEDRGKSRLSAAIEKAKTEKHWCDWTSKALAALNERYPLEFPAERAESRGTVPTGSIPLVGPTSVAAPEKAVQP